MAEDPLKGEISPLSQEFTDDQISVDVMIYKMDGNDGWTLEVALDEETALSWTMLFPTDQAAWNEFASLVRQLGLRRLIEVDGGEEVTVH
jgi:hypothetical protein